MNHRLVMPETLTYAFGETSITAFLVAQSSKGVAAILIRETLDRAALLRDLARRFSGAQLEEEANALALTVKAIQQFVEHPKADLALDLDIRGTPFQTSVYDAVLAIPFGKTTTYSAIAQAIGRPKAVRAVGATCANNPLEFAIPCHRVLRTDGRWAGGGQWGDWRQAHIVGRERAGAGE
jgi:AraC family transcriptional regulator, regulatory protein of adaptative response / methylated-DNA-[protein]-cysteine methyltransferase